MKSKDLIKIFELSSKILSYYKNKDVVYALTDILKMCEDKPVDVVFDKQLTIEKNNVLIYENSEKFLLKIKNMSLEEIKAHLDDKTIFPNIESLRSISVGLGFKSQPRASRDITIHTILKLIDRSRIEESISTRNE